MHADGLGAQRRDAAVDRALEFARSPDRPRRAPHRGRAATFVERDFRRTQTIDASASPGCTSAVGVRRRRGTARCPARRGSRRGPCRYDQVMRTVGADDDALSAIEHEPLAASDRPRARRAPGRSALRARASPRRRGSRPRRSRATVRRAVHSCRSAPATARRSRPSTGNGSTHERAARTACMTIRVSTDVPPMPPVLFRHVAGQAARGPRAGASAMPRTRSPAARRRRRAKS